MATTLQASLLVCSRISFPFPSHNSLSLSKLSLYQFHHCLPSSISCSQSNPVGAASNLIENETQTLTEETSVVNGTDAENSNPSFGEEKSEGVENNREEEVGDGRLPMVVLFVGLWARAKKSFSDFVNWVPFWQQERRLARLIADAEANPQDVAKQTALLVELNKHSPECVIKHFEERQGIVDGRGVVEYLRAFVTTNAIAEYLPDENSGKPSGLPTLLQELKQHASGNSDESILSPGVSEKQPLHVFMVDPKASKKSHFVQDFFSTILFTVATGLVWVVGFIALQKSIGSLGGVGTSGIGSSTSYGSKELNKEMMPETVNILRCI